MTPAMGYTEMKDSGIEWVGRIPAHWTTIANKYVMRKKKRICAKWENQSVLSLTMNGVIVRDILNPVGKMPTTFDGYQFAYSGELLMCLFDIDVTPRCVGRVFCDGVTSPAYSCFQLNGTADLGYYYYYYLMVDNTKELLHLAKNLRHSFTEEQLGMLKVPFPPLSEQSAIAAYLDAQCAKIDEIIAEAKASIEDYKQWKASIIYEAVTKGLDPNAEMKNSGIEWIGEIPKGWNTIRLKYAVAIKKDIAGELGHTVLSVTQQGIKPKNMHDKGQFALDYSKYQLVTPGDFIMNHMDLLTGWIDISSSAGVTSPDYRVFTINFPDRFNPQYYRYVFQNCYRHKIFYGLGQGVSGLGRWRLPASMFLNFCVPVPPKDRQKEIAMFLDEVCAQIDGLIVEKESLVTDLESYKKSLIYEVVTGKRRVC